MILVRNNFSSSGFFSRNFSIIGMDSVNRLSSFKAKILVRNNFSSSGFFSRNFSIMGMDSVNRLSLFKAKILVLKRAQPIYGIHTNNGKISRKEPGG